MFAAILAAAALTWYVDKTNLTDGQIKNNKDQTIHVQDRFNPVELGYKQQLSKNIPMGYQRTKHIGDIDDTNPLPYVNVQGGGENTNVTDMKQAVLPDQLKRFRALVHQRENIEEYWRFDNYLGDTFPNNMALHRQSSIAYRYQ